MSDVSSFVYQCITPVVKLIETGFPTFVAVTGAIFTGLVVNHFWAQWVNKTRREQLCSALTYTVTANADLVARIKTTIIDEANAPYINVDLTVLEATASLKYEILNDFDLCKAIDTLRYQLTYFARKVDLRLSVEFDSSAQSTFDDGGCFKYESWCGTLADGIKHQLDSLADTFNHVLRNLDLATGHTQREKIVFLEPDSDEQ